MELGSRCTDEKKVNLMMYYAKRIPEAILTSATFDEIKLAQQEYRTLDKVIEMLKSGEENVTKSGDKPLFVTIKELIKRKF